MTAGKMPYDGMREWYKVMKIPSRKQIVTHDIRNTLEVIQRNTDFWVLARSAHGNQMENSVGRSPSHHHHSDRILKGSFGHDISWLDILRQQDFHGLTSCHTLVCFLLRIGRGRRRIGQRHTCTSGKIICQLELRVSNRFIFAKCSNHSYLMLQWLSP
jgi:hypothetical protein